jgi:hypothetical protein
MTREDVIRMAKEAKLNIGPAGMGQTVWGGDAELERFAVLVAAAEREACAKVCEDEIRRIKPVYSPTADIILRRIRERSQS